MSRALKQVLQSYKESVARIHQELTITQILQIQACVSHSTMSSYEISIPCGNLDTDTNTSTRQYRRRISTRMNVSVSTAHNINRRLKFLSHHFHKHFPLWESQNRSNIWICYRSLVLGHESYLTSPKTLTENGSLAPQGVHQGTHSGVYHEKQQESQPICLFRSQFLFLLKTMLEQSYTWRDWEVGSLMLSVSSSFQTGSFVLVFTEKNVIHCPWFLVLKFHVDWGNLEVGKCKASKRG